MCRPEEIAVVIPCLNEGRTIGPLVRNVRRYIPHVIIVNDGSTDSTAREAELAGAIVIQHTSSQGKGASLRAGIDQASRAGFLWALAMDGDAQHAPTDIPAFLKLCESSAASMIIGNRMTDLRSMPRIRRFVNSWMSEMISRFCKTPIPDSQCGFRMVRLNAWNRLQFFSDHFEIESEMIVRFLKAGHTIDFVPVQTRYGSECSKIRPLRDTLRWLRWWLAIRHELASNLARSTRPGYRPTPQDATA